MKQKITANILKSEIDELVIEATTIEGEIKRKKHLLNQKKNELNHLNQQLKKLKAANRELIVSQHAIVRYFERVKGFDIAAIEKEILSSSVVKMIETLGGNGTYPNENGFSVIMQNFTVTTIIKD